ncbi:MAG: D-alanine--D-alanine ligase [Candidatus Omnitrophica bacterium]|nr:D-alanine--D-alanine ligase [Candidatus Omnitrophota bacterium]
MNFHAGTGDMMSSIEGLKGKRIGVLAGGRSSEREISLKSGRAVFSCLEANGMDVTFLDVDDNSVEEAVKASGIDIAFIALHGRFGEDGKLQAILEGMGIGYTGSGPRASELAMDKLASKERFLSAGLKTPEYLALDPGRWVDPDGLWVPCVVKPRYEGSSFGLTVVRKKDGIAEAIKKAAIFGEDVLIEEYIHGRELTVGVLGGKALPIVEIVTPEQVYDHDAKYVHKSTRYLVPADLSLEVAREVREAGSRAHDSLGCEGFSRVDIRLSERSEAYVLEVNTIPGLTERSLLPMAAAAYGLDFFGLCVNMLMSAMSRAGTK